jgi:hypothetical protein
MNAEEFKKRALAASEKEFAFIKAHLERAADTGSYSCIFNNISDGAREHLQKSGYEVVKRTKYVKRGPFQSKSVDYYEVKVKS